MINFENNWSLLLPATLPSSAESLSVGLPPGRYRLTIAASAAPDAERECVSAFVDNAGVATLIRGAEFTQAQEWPAGSLAFCSITSEVLGGVFLELQSLRERVAALDSRANAQYLEIEFNPSGWEVPDYFSSPFIRSITYAFQGGSPEPISINGLFFAGGSPVPYQASWQGAPAALLPSVRKFSIAIPDYWLSAGDVLTVTLGGIASDGAVRVRSNSAPEMATAEVGFTAQAGAVVLTLTAVA